MKERENVIVGDQDIFYLGVDALVNPVNSVGTMGNGLACAFKYKFPENFKMYLKTSRKNRMSPGRIMTHHEKGVHVINFPTKVHWRHKSKLLYIELGLNKVREFLLTNDIKSIAIPAIGCGKGCLKWEDVFPLVMSMVQQVHMEKPEVVFYISGEDLR